MEIMKALALATKLMLEHCPDYKFQFSSAKKRFGSCNYRTKTIKLSCPMVLLNSEEEVRKVILHEIAHALTKGHHHDAVWQAKCLEIGGDGKRCYGDEVDTPNGRYVMVCPHCYKEYHYHRELKRAHACIDCCNSYAGGRYCASYKLQKKEEIVYDSDERK